MKRNPLILIAIPVIIGAGGLLANFLPVFDDYRDFAQGRSVPRSLTESGTTGKEFRLLDYGNAPDIMLQGIEQYGDFEDFPSSTVTSPSVFETVLSLSVPNSSLWDPVSGIAANPFQTGRNYERPSSASIYDNGELVFASIAGIRIHGGKSRRMDKTSYRLHFRPLYGTRSVQSRLLFPTPPHHELTSFIVHNDVREYRPGVRWHFVNPIAYEIAKAVGCLTPRTRVARVHVNDVDEGVFVLTEHYSNKLFQNTIEHDEFVFVRTNEGVHGTQHGAPSHYNNLNDWASHLQADSSMQQVAERVDLENLTNWIIAVAYLGVTDAFQGPAILEPGVTGAVWRWHIWDLDHAFWDVYRQAEQPWLLDIFSGNENLEAKRDPRALLFTHLRNNDPEYRHYFLTRFTEVMNHRLTDEFLDTLRSRYSELAKRYDINNSSFDDAFAQFIEKRPLALRRQVGGHFDAGPAHRFTVEADSGLNVSIDGYNVRDEFTGYYFRDTPVSVSVSSIHPESRLIWKLNDKPYRSDSPTATFSVDETTHLVLQLTGNSGQE